jgi:serine/threonine protein kinase
MYSSMVPWHSAAGVLWQVLTESTSFLPPTLPEYVLTRVLGDGASANVYEGYARSDDTVVCAVKLGKSVDAAQREAVISERHILRKLKKKDFWGNGDQLRHVPRYIGGVRSPAYEGFAMASLGAPFHTTAAPIRQMHVRQLVGVLRRLHAHGRVHRDVRESNLLYVRGDYHCVLLVDWAFVTRADRAVEYQGTLYSASDAVLESSKVGLSFTHTSTRADDLHALVRSVLLMSYPSLQPVLYSTVSPATALRDTVQRVGDFASMVQKFWRTHLRVPAWQALCAAADNLDYDTLCTAFPIPL